MDLSARTLGAIARIITGDEQISPYRSGPELVRLFNDYGANDTYGQGFPSRWKYTEDRLRNLSGTPAIAALLREVIDPREFLDTAFQVGTVIDYLNKRLRYDGYEVVVENDLPKIRDLKGASVECKHPFSGSTEDGHIFIDEQIEKSDRKIQEGDFDGAITNARSLLEAVLTEIEQELDPDPPKYDGNLSKLYRRVQKLLNLEPGRKDLETSLRQILVGMTSVVNGISGMSNRLGDRHVRTYRPEKHHAVLIVNAAKTLVSFLFDTQQYQSEKQLLSKH